MPKAVATQQVSCTWKSVTAAKICIGLWDCNELMFVGQQCVMYVEFSDYNESAVRGGLGL